jgi:hypothetical protein
MSNPPASPPPLPSAPSSSVAPPPAPGVSPSVSATSPSVWGKFQKRFKWVIEELLKQPLIRLLLVFWAASGVWDLVLGEYIPEEYAQHLPRVYQVVAMTAGLLSWQLWLLTGHGIVILAIIEYLFRRSGSAATPKPATKIINWRAKVPLLAGVAAFCGISTICLVALVHPPQHSALPKIIPLPAPRPTEPPFTPVSPATHVGGDIIVGRLRLSFGSNAYLSVISQDNIKIIRFKQNDVFHGGIMCQSLAPSYDITGTIINKNGDFDIITNVQTVPCRGSSR